MAFNLKATSLVDRVETTDKVIRETLQAFWTGQIQPTGSTGDLVRERENVIKSLGGQTKIITGWATELESWVSAANDVHRGSMLPVRGVFAANEAVATSLTMEPKVASWAPEKVSSDLPRWILVDAMIKSKDVLSWTKRPTLMLNALSLAMRTDPNPWVRLQVLGAIGVAKLPVSWMPTLLDALLRTKEVIPQTPFSTVARQKLWEALGTREGVIGNLLAEASQRENIAKQRGLPEPTMALNLEPPSGKPPIDWKPWAAVGVAITLLGGVVVLARKHHGHLALEEPQEQPRA